MKKAQRFFAIMHDILRSNTKKKKKKRVTLP